jgi:pilin isopeptide linkage protein/LPXTG-motif cell wall-anchored protein/uncharacterized repeat protein (TIGR01451 family)
MSAKTNGVWKRYLSALLSAAMVLSNAGMGSLTSYAGSTGTTIGVSGKTGTAWSADSLNGGSFTNTELYDAVSKLYSTETEGVTESQAEIWEPGEESDFSKIVFPGDPVYSDDFSTALVQMEITPKDCRTVIDKVRVAGYYGSEGLASFSDAEEATSSNASSSDAEAKTYVYSAQVNADNPVFLIYYRTSQEDESGNVSYVGKDAGSVYAVNDPYVDEIQGAHALATPGDLVYEDPFLITDITKLYRAYVQYQDGNTSSLTALVAGNVKDDLGNSVSGITLNTDAMGEFFSDTDLLSASVSKVQSSVYATASLSDADGFPGLVSAYEEQLKISSGELDKEWEDYQANGESSEYAGKFATNETQSTIENKREIIFKDIYEVYFSSFTKKKMPGLLGKIGRTIPRTTTVTMTKNFGKTTVVKERTLKFSTLVYFMAAQSNASEPVYLDLSAGKTFAGGYVTDGKFTYKVTGSDDAADYSTKTFAVTPDGASSSTGTAAIGSLEFTKAGTYTYTVSENDSGDAGITYDPSTHVVKAVVTETANGFTETVTLDGNPVGEWTSTQTTDYDSATNTATEKSSNPAKVGKDGGLTFTNKVKPPKAAVTATKALDWPTGAVPANEYSFTLTPKTDYGSDVTYSSNGTDVSLGTTVLTAGNSGTAVTFPELTFAAKTKTYTFTLAEADTAASSSYDKDATTYTVTISVAPDAATGIYAATVTHAKADGSAATGASFTNKRKVSSLEIDKAAVGQGSSQTQLFDFALTFDGEYTSLISNNTAGGSTASDVNIATVWGVTVVTYKLNGTLSGYDAHSKLVLAGVPVGANYTAAETADASYFPNSSWTHTESSTAADNVHTFANQMRTANFYISKEVQGEHADKNYEFTFNFAFQTPVGSIPFEHIYYKVSDDDGVTYGDAQELSVTKSDTTYSGSLQIHGGQVVEFVDLPVGGSVAYTVVEQADDLYTPNLVGRQDVTINEGDAASGVKVNYINTKNAPETLATWTPAATKTVDSVVPASVITGSDADGSAKTSPFADLFRFSTKLQSEPDGATVTYGTTPDTLSVGSSLTKTNTAEGTVTFDTLTFDKEGTYTFQVTEDTASTAYVTKDSSVYTVTVPVKYETYIEKGVTKDRLVVDTVTMKKDGVAATEIVFDNKTVAPAPATGTFIVSKTLDGNKPASGEFSFTVKRTSAPDNADSFADLTVQNGADGSVNFGTVSYAIAGTYVYTIKEVIPDSAETASSVIYDRSSYTVTVTVAYDGTNDGTNDNKLAVKKTEYKADNSASSALSAVFENFSMPSYTMSKSRVTSASQKGATGKYGFYRGDKVTYNIVVTNTGKLPLTMNVTDAFDPVIASYFSTPYVTDVNGEGVTKNTEITSTTTEVNVTIQTGKTATVTYTATVQDSAPEYLANYAADDNGGNTKISGDGYLNTATASYVTATATKSDGTPVIYTSDSGLIDKDGKNPLEDKHDTANTPVQVPVPGYTIEKSRVTKAEKKGSTDTYGFRYGDTVTYSVTVTNTGDLPVTMDVSDSFADSMYFTDLTYTTVTGTDVKWNNNTSGTAPNITIGCNSTHDNKAVITVTAIVAAGTPENLANYAADDNGGREKIPGDGYLNTAAISVVKATYTTNTGTTVTYDKEYTDSNGNHPLEDKHDTANTPVQVPTVSYEMSKSRVTSAEVKAGTDPAKYGFKRGEKVTYEVTVTNTGDEPLTMNVSDSFADSTYFSDLTYTTVTGTDVTWNNNSSGGKTVPNITIGCNSTHDNKAVITVTALVAEDTPENLDSTPDDKKDGKGYLNTATTSDVTADVTVKPITGVDENGKTEYGTETTTTYDKDTWPKNTDGTSPLDGKKAIAHTPVQVPVPGYTMIKSRITPAAEKGSTGKYGFNRGDTVTYTVTVKNTGNMDLTMNVEDAFDPVIASCFSDPAVTAVTQSEGTDKGTVTYTPTALPTTGAVKVKLPAGISAEITYTATVKDTAPEYLADYAADDNGTDNRTDGDGYRNTVTASDVTATATKSDGTPVTYYKDTYPKDTEGKTPLDDKYDTANTPVKLTPSYTMEKTRVTEAPAKGSTAKYGFLHGDTVTYMITVVNTGETILTMDVNDLFADSTYFTDITYQSVIGTDVTWNNNMSGAATTTAPNITIGCNGTHDNKAVITVTAVVASVTPESLSNTAADDGKGYENTAETINVVSKATESDGTKTTTATTSLEDRRNTAHTPVQVTAVTPGNGGGGGGNTPDTSVKPINPQDKGTPGTHTVTNGGYADGTDLYGFNPDGTPMGNIWTAGGNLPKTGEAWRNLALLLGAVSLLMLFLFLILIRRKRQADNMEHSTDPYKSKSK